MMKNVFILLKAWVFLYPCFSFSQNLIQNDSFEDTISCPVFLNELNKANGWFRPTSGSSDLLHSCSVFAGVPTNPTGVQNPRTGEAYAGIITYLILDGREYIETGLISALEQGKNYPDPFRELTYIPYKLPGEYRKGMIKIFDAKGNLIKAYTLDKENNILEVKTSGWANGMYFYSIELDGVIMQFDKMILLK